MNAKPLTFRRSLAISLGKGGFILALILAWGIPFTLGGGFDMAPPATDEEVMSIRPSAEGSPAALVERHGCWTGEAPADVVTPGHVVVTPEGQAPRYAGPAMVEKALDQMFGGADHGLRVHGFCR